MSYDIHVCFPHADFPLAELREVLAAFGLRTGESPNKPYWSIRLDAGRIVSLDRREITARYPGWTCFPPNTRWNVVVSVGGPDRRGAGGPVRGAVCVPGPRAGRIGARLPAPLGRGVQRSEHMTWFRRPRTACRATAN